ncbi:MAG: Imm26 family immunity protein [Actinomycetota bacterium]
MVRVRERPAVGDVVQFELPGGRWAYGRILRDASVAFYRQVTNEPGQPPIGSRNYLFVVGVHDSVFRSPLCSIVGHDPSSSGHDDWPPPFRVDDPITGNVSVYKRGSITPASKDVVEGLEPAAVWELNHLLARLTHELE